jgi:hypothetical protein
MRMLHESHDIFQQLAQSDGPAGVKVLIENHDAWLHNQEADAPLIAALRVAAAQSVRDPARASRIERQRHNLQHLVTRLRIRTAAAS